MAQKGKPAGRMSQQVRPENRLAQLYRETVAELRKVVWPTRQEAINLTIIVVLVVVAMSLFLGAIDAVLTQVMRLILLR